MARGKPLTLDQIRDSIYFHLLGVERKEIAGYLDLNEDSVKRMRTRQDYQKLTQHLAEHLKQLSTAELQAIIDD